MDYFLLNALSKRLDFVESHVLARHTDATGTNIPEFCNYSRNPSAIGETACHLNGSDLPALTGPVIKLV